MTYYEADALRLRLRLKRRLAQLERRVCPQEPLPKQREFLALDCFEALYGGAAGGGKSSALLMAASQYVHVPGYCALLLRRTYPELSEPGALMARAKEWWYGKASWNEQSKKFTWPSGSSISFGYCDTERDRYRYQGAEYQFIGVDELTQWPENWYMYLLSRLRRTNTNPAPIRARATANPGGIGHDWVKRRFIDSDSREDRAFIPARASDNTHLAFEEYARTLERLDSVTRAQLLDGIWVRDSSGLVYSRFKPDDHMIDEVPKLSYYLLGVDYGYEDSCAFAVLGWRDHDPTVYVVEAFKRRRLTPSASSAVVRELSETYEPVKIVADVGGLGKGYAEEARARFTLPIEPARKENKLGYIGLMNGDIERGRVKLRRGTADELADEWLHLAWDDSRTKEMGENHASDAALYAWRATSAYHNTPEEVKPPEQQWEEKVWKQVERNMNRDDYDL